MNNYNKSGWIIHARNLILSKRSQSHVEMILSFSLFMSVLMIIFLFLNPLANIEKKDYDIEAFQKIFLDEISSKVGKLSVILEDENSCYELPAEYGNKFIESLDKQNSRRYFIYFSEDFRIGSISCSSKPLRKFRLSVYSEENMIVYEKISELKTRYESDYESLKEYFGIKNIFLWNFKSKEGNIISTMSVSKKIPAGIKTNAKEFPVIVIDKSGQVYEWILNIIEG
jgi:hypothetical protein